MAGSRTRDLLIFWPVACVYALAAAATLFMIGFGIYVVLCDCNVTLSETETRPNMAVLSQIADLWYS
jgi:hypothetical protein